MKYLPIKWNARIRRGLEKMLFQCESTTVTGYL